MRSLIDRYHLREKFKIRMPFDGSVHPYEEMCRLIQTDFVDYETDVVIKDNVFCNNNGVIWNHEITNNIDDFKGQLHKRVEQFRQILNAGEPVLFLIHNKNKNLDFNFDLIECALKLKYPNLKYHVFVFNNYHPEFYINKTATTTYVNMFWNPHDTHDYYDLNYDHLNNDFITQMYVTPYGVHFSLKVLKEICMILNEEYDSFVLNNNYVFNDALN
jgi:hypothetical protein